MEEIIDIEDQSLNGAYNFDSNLMATLKQIKIYQDKDILLDTILQYLKTYSIPTEIQRNHPKIVEAIISNKFNLKPIETIFSTYRAQPLELANIEKQMREFIK